MLTSAVRIASRLSAVAVALALAGCASVTRDSLPAGAAKGYAEFTLEVGARGRYRADLPPQVWNIPVCRKVDGRVKRLGTLRSNWDIFNCFTTCSRLRVSAKPGRETFVVGDQKIPIDVEIVEGMVTPVTIVLTTLQTPGLNPSAGTADSCLVVPRCEKPVAIGSR